MTAQRTTDLGPNQIRWLKDNVPQFGPAKDAADRVKAHQEEVARQMPAPISLCPSGSSPEKASAS